MKAVKIVGGFYLTLTMKMKEGRPLTVSVKYGPHAAKIKSSVTKKETKLRFVKFTFGLPGNLKARRPTKPS